VRGARRLQDARVVAIGKQPALAFQLAVDRARHAHAQALYASSQRPPIVCLDQQVEVVALHREMHEPKAKSLPACSEGVAYARK
jgi:hypothetical protein